MPDVFVSYKRSDAHHAERFALLLRALGLETFFDKDDMLPGGTWRPEIENALRNSRAIAVLLGPSGLGGTQSLEEQFMHQECEKRKVVLFRVILPGAEPGPTSIAGLNTYVDLRNGVDNRDELLRIQLAVKGRSEKQRFDRGATAAATATVKDVEDAVDAIVTRLPIAGLTLLVGSAVSIPSTFDMAKRLSERLRENDPEFPPVSSLDVASAYYAVDRDDELAVEMEIKELLRGSTLDAPGSLLSEISRLARQVQDRLGRLDAGQPVTAAGQAFKQAARPFLIVTTTFDLRLERALLRAGVSFRRIVQYSSEARLDVKDYTPSLQANALKVVVSDHAGTTVSEALLGVDDLAGIDKAVGTVVEPILFRERERAKQLKNPLTTLPLGRPSTGGVQIVLYKPYGSQELSGSCAISCDHHYRFALRSLPEGWVPDSVIETIGNTTLVVLGYNLFDPGYRLVSYTLLANRLTSQKMFVVRPQPNRGDPSVENRVEAALWNDVKVAWSKVARLLDVSESDFLRSLQACVTRKL